MTSGVEPRVVRRLPPVALGGEVTWQVQNRSNSGLRVSAVGGKNHGLALGALVAIRPRQGGDWALGVVRRLVKATSESIDVGVSVPMRTHVPRSRETRAPGRRA